MIPVCRPTLTGKEKEYVMDCLDTNWISSNGKYIKQFEDKFAAFCGVKHGVSCSNGTAALHLALVSLGIKKGDEVIVPNFTMIATANAVIYTGAKPVFVDSELETWNMNVSSIEEKITSKTKAIIVVHTYGCPVDMDEVNRIAKKNSLYVIEDAAEAHGAIYKGMKVGSLADVACFSFYANKIITTGEGGMIVTNNDAIAEAAKSFRNHCFGEPRFLHDDVGFNYRMTNIQAAIGCAQVDNIHGFVGCRIANAREYNKKLKDVEGITLPPECKHGKNVYWMYGILIDKEKFGMDKFEVMIRLKELGVDTRSFFFPTHSQFSMLDRFGNDDENSYPVSVKLYEEGLYLPSSSDLTIEEIDEVVSKLKGLKNENIIICE